MSQRKHAQEILAANLADESKRARKEQEWQEELLLAKLRLATNQQQIDSIIAERNAYRKAVDQYLLCYSKMNADQFDELDRELTRVGL